MKRLIFNGKAYADLKGGTLGTGNGFFVRQSNGVRLYKADRKLEAFIVSDDRQGYFVVSASANCEGVPRFMFSTCSLTEEWLGIEDMGLSQTHDLVKAMRYVDEEVTPKIQPFALETA